MYLEGLQNQQGSTHSVSDEDCQKLWIEAVEALAENIELKQRVEFLERQIAVNAFGGWQTH